MKRYLIKLFFEFIDTIYILIGSVLIILAYIYFSNGAMGLPESLWSGLLGVVVAFVALLFPYYAILKIKHNKEN